MKTLQRFLNRKDSPYALLKKHVLLLDRLTQSLHAFLPEEWREHCQVVRFDQGQCLLVISTNVQTLVTPLRFMQKQLLSQLPKKNPALKALTKIDFIYTRMQTESTAATPVLNHSTEAANACLNVAQSCPPALQKALERLAKTINGD